MSVGILDADLYQHGAVPFNLDVMKLSSYYKKNRELVSLTPYFCPEKYSKYIVRKDIYDDDFRGFDFSKSKIEYGGLGFSSGKYIPLDYEVERSIPDINIYSRMEKYYSENTDNKRLFEMMLNAKHIRLSIDGKNIWEDCFKYTNQVQNFHSLFIHDIDLVNLQGARQFILDNLPYEKIYIQNKFPIVTRTDKDFYDWYVEMYMGICNTFQHYGILSDSNILEIVKGHKGRAERLEYFVVDYNTDIQDFVSNQLPHVLRQAVFLWNNQRTISLKYVENVLPEKEIERYLDLVNMYMKYSYLLRYEKTLYEFIKLLKWRSKKGFSNFGFSLGELRNIMTYIRDNCPETFELSYSLNKTIFKGEKIENG